MAFESYKTGGIPTDTDFSGTCYYSLDTYRRLKNINHCLPKPNPYPDPTCSQKPNFNPKIEVAFTPVVGSFGQYSVLVRFSLGWHIKIQNERSRHDIMQNNRYVIHWAFWQLSSCITRTTRSPFSGESNVGDRQHIMLRFTVPYVCIHLLWCSQRAHSSNCFWE